MFFGRSDQWVAVSLPLIGVIAIYVLRGIVETVYWRIRFRREDQKHKRRCDILRNTPDPAERARLVEEWTKA